MITWNIYQSDKDYTDKEKMILGTFELVVWLIFSKKKYIVTINRRKD